MAIDPKLLETLACPVCKNPDLEEDESGLFCETCRRVYPIKDGIPMMLEEDAVVRPGGSGAA